MGSPASAIKTGGGVPQQVRCPSPLDARGPGDQAVEFVADRLWVGGPSGGRREHQVVGVGPRGPDGVGVLVLSLVVVLECVEDDVGGFEGADAAGGLGVADGAEPSVLVVRARQIQVGYGVRRLSGRTPPKNQDARVAELAWPGVVSVRVREGGVGWVDAIRANERYDRRGDGCGMPCIDGTRLPVATIVSLVAEGATPTAIAGSYPQLVVDDICAALEYCRCNGPERRTPLAHRRVRPRRRTPATDRRHRSCRCRRRCSFVRAGVATARARSVARV